MVAELIRHLLLRNTCNRSFVTTNDIDLLSSAGSLPILHQKFPDHGDYSISLHPKVLSNRCEGYAGYSDIFGERL